MSVIITDHALERFMQRLPGVTQNGKRAERRLERWLDAAQPAIVKPKYRLTQMLNHHPDTEYRMYRGMVFVIKDDVLITVHMNESERFCYTASITEKTPVR